jgi:hypothetical protein
MTILCQQVANWAVDGLDYLLEKYVVVDVPLRGIGPQRFPFSMLQFVIARFPYQLLGRLRWQRWRQCHGSSQREDDETGNVSQQRHRYRQFHDGRHPDNVMCPCSHRQPAPLRQVVVFRCSFERPMENTVRKHFFTSITKSIVAKEIKRCGYERYLTVRICLPESCLSRLAARIPSQYDTPAQVSVR